MVTDFTPLAAPFGGALIGLATVALLALNCRIAGVSGIAHAVFRQSRRRLRLAPGLFLIGTCAAAATPDPTAGFMRL